MPCRMPAHSYKDGGSVRFTRIHVNAMGAALVGIVAGCIMAAIGKECFAGMIVTGALGLAINFAPLPDKNGSENKTGQ